MKAYNLRNNNLFATEIEIADKFHKRLLGLMFKESIDINYALLIHPCNSIHMFFMKFPIDVLFIDKNNKVVHLIKGIKPWRISKIYFKSQSVLEMNKGTIEKYDIKVGDIIKFQ